MNWIVLLFYNVAWGALIMLGWFLHQILYCHNLKITCIFLASDLNALGYIAHHQNVLI